MQKVSGLGLGSGSTRAPGLSGLKHSVSIIFFAAATCRAQEDIVYASHSPVANVGVQCFVRE